MSDYMSDVQTSTNCALTRNGTEQWPVNLCTTDDDVIVRTPSIVAGKSHSVTEKFCVHYCKIIEILIAYPITLVGSFRLGGCGLSAENAVTVVDRYPTTMRQSVSF